MVGAWRKQHPKSAVRMTAYQGHTHTLLHICVVDLDMNADWKPTQSSHKKKLFVKKYETLMAESIIAVVYVNFP